MDAIYLDIAPSPQLKIAASYKSFHFTNFNTCVHATYYSVGGNFRIGLSFVHDSRVLLRQTAQHCMRHVVRWSSIIGLLTRSNGRESLIHTTNKHYSIRPFCLISTSWAHAETQGSVIWENLMMVISIIGYVCMHLIGTLQAYYKPTPGIKLLTS